jgi:hypothetical protein
MIDFLAEQARSLIAWIPSHLGESFTIVGVIGALYFGLQKIRQNRLDYRLDIHSRLAFYETTPPHGIKITVTNRGRGELSFDEVGVVLMDGRRIRYNPLFSNLDSAFVVEGRKNRSIEPLMLLSHQYHFENDIQGVYAELGDGARKIRWIWRRRFRRLLGIALRRSKSGF